MTPINARLSCARHVCAMLDPTARRAASILIVDDDPALLAALSFAFETQGFSVSAHPSAESALGDLRVGRQCLVVDQRLPGICGLDLLDELRRRGERAPAVLITTHPNAPVRARAAAACVEIIEKPLLGDRLVQCVLALAGRS